LFKSEDYKGMVQKLGEELAEELGIEFVQCEYNGEIDGKKLDLAFLGTFRYKGNDIKVKLVTRKGLEDKTYKSEIESVKAELLEHKLYIDNLES